MKGFLLSGVMILLFNITACAPVWMHTSEPAIQTTANQVYELSLEPLKEDQSYYSFFKLTVVNRSSDPIEIDWNQTRYLFNGKLAKGFIFKGVTAEQVKNSSIPTDVVPPGATLVKNIAAVRLIAWAPVREKSVTTAEHRFSAGAMPDGENGVLLFITQNGRSTRQKITVRIRSEATR